ncbi:MAG: hypothetical protein QOD39_1119 [Mycobacterium sp.]|nr:hypothetical protein [Mycobacterium sp.]
MAGGVSFSCGIVVILPESNAIAVRPEARVLLSEDLEALAG